MMRNTEAMSEGYSQTHQRESRSSCAYTGKGGQATTLGSGGDTTTSYPPVLGICYTRWLCRLDVQVTDNHRLEGLTPDHHVLSVSSLTPLSAAKLDSQASLKLNIDPLSVRAHIATLSWAPRPQRTAQLE